MSSFIGCFAPSMPCIFTQMTQQSAFLPDGAESRTFEITSGIV